MVFSTAAPVAALITFFGLSHVSAQEVAMPWKSDADKREKEDFQGKDMGARYWRPDRQC